VAEVSINLLDAISIVVAVVAGGLLALVLWRWYSMEPDGGPGVGDGDPWTMRLAIVTLTVWAIAGARLFGLV
jgi:hypothetical protein